MPSLETSMIALAGLFLSAPPQDEAPPPPPAAEKKVCKRIVPTGSMMSKRFCLTPSEWRRFEGLNQSDAGTALRRRGSGMCDVSCR